MPITDEDILAIAPDAVLYPEEEATTSEITTETSIDAHTIPTEIITDSQLKQDIADLAISETYQASTLEEFVRLAGRSRQDVVNSLTCCQRNPLPSGGG